MNATEFNDALIKEKQENKLNGWRAWGQKMTLLRLIHQEIEEVKTKLAKEKRANGLETHVDRVEMEMEAI